MSVRKRGSYVFEVDMAVEIGLEEAIMVRHFQFWLNKNADEGRNQHDGHTWSYNSVKAIEKTFPFWTYKITRRVLDSLKTKGVLITGNYNKNQNDRTLWYAFADEDKYLGLACPNGQLQGKDQANADARTGPPLPDIKPVGNTDKRTQSGDARHAPLKLFLEAEYRRITGEALPTKKPCWIVFAEMLKAYHDEGYTLEYFQESWRRFLNHPDRFFKTQANPLRYWASRPHAFSPNLRTAPDAKRSRSEILDAATETLLTGEIPTDLFRDHGAPRPGAAHGEGLGPESDGISPDAR